MARDLDNLIDSVPGMRNRSRETLHYKVFEVRRRLNDHMPFIVKQFKRKMEHVVADAKSNVEAFVTGVVHRTGLTALLGHAPAIAAPANETETPALTEGETDA